MAAHKKRVLIVAHQTAGSPELMAEVKARAERSPAEFTLVVPSVAHGLHRVVDPQDHDKTEARGVLALALPKLSSAAGSEVKGVVGDSNPLDAAHDAVNLGDFDEIIVSTLPHTVSKWLKLDLPHKLRGLGLPVTTVTATEVDRTFVTTSN